MSPRPLGRLTRACLAAAALIVVSACQSEPEPEPAAPTSVPVAIQPEPAPSSGPLRDEIPAAALADVMKAHVEGIGLLEQYEYQKAIAAFREVHAKAPGWIAGSINLAIALLNKSGEDEAAKKKQGGEGQGISSNFQEALGLLGDVLKRDPENPHAHYCSGIILEQIGRLADANTHFRKVVEKDPRDAAAWYWVATTVTDSDNPGLGDARKQARQQIEPLEKSLQLDPYLVQALYKLQQAYRLAGDPAKAKSVMERWRSLLIDQPGPAPGTGNVVEKTYGEMGRYASAIDPFGKPDDKRTAAPSPRFGPWAPIQVAKPSFQRWAKDEDFTGNLAVIGRIRTRLGASVSAFDVDGDGHLDLYLASAVVGLKGPRDVLLRNLGDGKFEDISLAYGIPADRASVGVAVADFDADRHIDLFLTGIGDNRLLRNKDGKAFEDVSASLKSTGPKALALTARWLDLDQDGDLDLYVLNYCEASKAAEAFRPGASPPPGLANVAYRNDGRPDPKSAQTIQGQAPIATAFDVEPSKRGLTIAFTAWPERSALSGGARPHVGVAWLDLENDRDFDLVLAHDGGPPVALLNDRLGRFHEAAIQAPADANLDGFSGLLATDIDADGRTDLVAPRAEDFVLAWRNTTDRTTTDPPKISFARWPINVTRWRSAQAIDLDLDGLPDLVGPPIVPAKGSGVPGWARNEAKRFVGEFVGNDVAIDTSAAMQAIDLVGDALPDLLAIQTDGPPQLARNLGNGQHWLALRLGGHWRVKPQLMRTNPHAIGTRIALEGQGVRASYDLTTPDAGLGQSIAPVVLGLGKSPRVDLVHLRWPDGVIQCELNLAGDSLVEIRENNRKTGSCPVLFTWNGERYVCLGDFLGGGGLGYMVAPGVYGQPDRDESMAIAADQLRPISGRFRISVTEPMDEIAYVDHLKLEVIDRPPGVSSTPDERFAPEGPRPTGEPIAWRTRIDPVRAEDIDGRDLTETLRDFDRRTADHFQRLAEWSGYTEEHGIVLDFGDRLSRYSPTDRLVLCLAGWVEYPYSQTNYAAATAGVVLSPPTIERRRDDGTWEVIVPHAGYPAGLPRLMTTDLTGKLTGPRCVIRIRTNMECYYDQAFIAVRDPGAEKSLRIETLPVASATLAHRGYTREVSPDGRLPLLYDYDYVDPAPLAWFSGKMTRYGDVRELLTSDDDHLCLVGPGDEIRIEFDASSLPKLSEGWTRSFVLRSYGYCKDADPFTAKSETVSPLPWRGMPPFPFGPEVKRPEDPAYRAYLREYQTRTAGGE